MLRVFAHFIPEDWKNEAHALLSNAKADLSRDSNAKAKPKKVKNALGAVAMTLFSERM